MASDYKMAVITSRCAQCARPVSASLAGLRETGLFSCICGAVTPVRYTPPVEPLPVRSGWRRGGTAPPAE